jgi:hypothetical protein
MHVWIAYASGERSAGIKDRRAAADRHAAAQRNLFGRLISCLHHCLITGQHYDENAAFPPPAPADQAVAA